MLQTTFDRDGVQLGRAAESGAQESGTVLARRGAVPGSAVQRRRESPVDKVGTAERPSESRVPGALLQSMEHVLGHGLSDVRVHVDSAAASTLGALAYTQGREVHFAPGQYQPQSLSGRRLIAHEFTHVKQQAEGRVDATSHAMGVPINDDPALEREADSLGSRAASATVELGSDVPAGPRGQGPGLSGSSIQAKWLDDSINPFYRWHEANEQGVRWYAEKQSGELFFRIVDESKVPDELLAIHSSHQGFKNKRTRDAWLKMDNFHWDTSKTWSESDLEVESLVSTSHQDGPSVRTEEKMARPKLSPLMARRSPKSKGVMSGTSSTSTQKAKEGFHLDAQIISGVTSLLSSAGKHVEEGERLLIRFFNDAGDMQSKQYQAGLPGPDTLPSKKSLLDLAVAHMYRGKTDESPFVSFTEDISAFLVSVSESAGADVSIAVRSIVRGGTKAFVGKRGLEKLSRPPAKFIGIFKVAEGSTVSWKDVAPRAGSSDPDLKKNFIPEREVVAFSPQKLQAPVAVIDNPYFNWFMK